MESLLRAMEPAWSCTDVVVLDFTDCTFISAHGVAVLVTLKLQRDLKGLVTRVSWETIRDRIGKQLGRWNVAPLFGGPDHPWTDNAIPLFLASDNRPETTVGYVQKWIVGHSAMPSMTTDLAKATCKAFCEIVGNIFRHADSPVGGLAMGQVYPKVKEFQICIWDGGIGLVRRVQDAGHGLDSSPAAIEWALQQGHSTAATGPAGLGLYLLREFVKVNGGIFRIYANGGCYSERAGLPMRNAMIVGFPGTLIELKLKIRGDITYCLE